MLDYFLRDGFYEGILEIEWIHSLLQKIKIINGRIVLNDIQMAKEFFHKTIQINDIVYMSPFSRGQYKIFMFILREALETHVIDADEIVYGYCSDTDIYNKIKKMGNQRIQFLIQLLETTTEYSFKKNKNENFRKINSKIVRTLRFLNPTCVSENRVSDISDIDINIRVFLVEKKEQYEKPEKLYVENKIVSWINEVFG